MMMIFTTAMSQNANPGSEELNSWKAFCEIPLLHLPL